MRQHFRSFKIIFSISSLLSVGIFSVMYLSENPLNKKIRNLSQYEKYFLSSFSSGESWVHLNKNQAINMLEIENVILKGFKIDEGFTELSSSTKCFYVVDIKNPENLYAELSSSDISISDIGAEEFHLSFPLDLNPIKDLDRSFSTVRQEKNVDLYINVETPSKDELLDLLR